MKSANTSNDIKYIKMQLEYIQNLAWDLEITLGAHHKYYNTLEGIMKDKNKYMA